MKDSLLKQLRRAGFRDSETHELVREQGEHTIYAVLNRGTGSSVIGISYWVYLQSATTERDGFRSTGNVLEAPVGFTVRRRGLLDNLGTGLGLNSEVSIPDKFAGMVYVESTAPVAAVASLIDGPFLESADELARDFCKLSLSETRGRLTVTRTSLLKLIRPDVVRNHCRLLVKAHEQLPAFERVTTERAEGPDGFQRASILLLLAAIVGFFALVSTTSVGFVPNMAHPGTPTALALGAVGLVVFFAQRARGSSIGFRRFCLLTIPGLFAWAVWTLTAAGLIGSL